MDGNEEVADRGGGAPSRTARARPHQVAAAVALGVLVLAGGVALAAVTVHSGPFSGSGVDDAGAPLPWWTQLSTGTSTVPSPAPAAASANASAPTVLGSSSEAFGLNALTAGDAAVVWTFTESAGAPASTELEIVFEESAGGAAATFTAFVQSPSSSPTASVSFSFYEDVGTHSIVLSSWLEISEACGSVGSCP